MKRLPVIRHLRALWMLWRVERFARICGSIGLGLGQPNPSDIEYIRKVWQGRA